MNVGDERHGKNPSNSTSLWARQLEEPAIGRQFVEAGLTDCVLYGLDVQIVARDVSGAKAAFNHRVTYRMVNGESHYTNFSRSYQQFA